MDYLKISRKCPECYQYGRHHSMCPNRPRPKKMYECDACGEGIFEDDYYYDIDDFIYCDACMDKMQKVAGAE